MSPFWGQRFKLPSSPQPVDTAAGHIWVMGREDSQIGLRLPSVLCGEKQTPRTAARFRPELKNPQGQESRVAGRAAAERDSLGTTSPCRARALPAGVAVVLPASPPLRQPWPGGHPGQSARSLEAPGGRI